MAGHLKEAFSNDFHDTKAVANPAAFTAFSRSSKVNGARSDGSAVRTASRDPWPANDTTCSRHIRPHVSWSTAIISAGFAMAMAIKAKIVIGSLGIDAVQFVHNNLAS